MESGSRGTIGHAHQCCRFQSYAKTVPSRMKLNMREPASMTMDMWSRRVTSDFYGAYQEIFSMNNCKSVLLVTEFKVTILTSLIIVCCAAAEQGGSHVLGAVTEGALHGHPAVVEGAAGEVGDVVAGLGTLLRVHVLQDHSVSSVQEGTGNHIVVSGQITCVGIAECTM